MLRLFGSTSLSTLVDDVAEHLSDVPADPFEQVMVCVPTLGMRRWVSQQLSLRLGTRPGSTDGIEANISLPFPATITKAIASATRGAAAPGDAPGSGGGDPWALHSLVWPVAGVLADARATPGDPNDRGGTSHPLGSVAALPPGATATGQAWRVAHLLDRYVTHRPDMVAAWLDSQETESIGVNDLDPAHLWQPELARRVAARIGAPCPALTIGDDLAAVASGDLVVDLPSRLALFGVSALTPHLARALEALGHHHDIEVYLSVASRNWWDTISASIEPQGAHRWSTRRKDLPAQPVDLAAHPLVRWAQPNGDTAALLAVAGLPEPSVTGPASADNSSGNGGPPSLLARLQHDIRTNTAPQRNHVWDPTDDSLRIHRCTGATRQVEVLRDAIGHLMASDPTLGEADIIICTPNVHRFSGLVRSVFSSPSTPSFAVRVTERLAGGDNPVLDAMTRLLALGDSRCTAAEVIDVLSNEAVARRFALTPDDLGLLADIAADSFVRWGLDATHRTRWGMPPTFTTNTWRAGWEQALWGTVLASGNPDGPGGAPPMLHLPPSDTAGVARLSRAIRQLGDTVASLAEPRTARQWADDLRTVVDTMTEAPHDGPWQRVRVTDALIKLGEDIDTAAHAGTVEGTGTEVVDLRGIRRLLDEYWPPDTQSVAFGTGAITLASLQAGRSLPHRVVCLLGIDHADLGGQPTDGDDLTAMNPDLGDHDHSTQQRQRLVEALLAAGDAVVITCDGTDPVKNSEIPLTVELAELVDAVGATVTGELADNVTRGVVVHHPRQPFDPALFATGRHAKATDRDSEGSRPTRPADIHRPWGFDQTHLAAAAILANGAPTTPPRAPGPGPDDQSDQQHHEVDVDLVRKFVNEPVKTFYQHTLEVVLPDEQGLTDDNLQLKLNGLDQWKLGESLMDALVSRRTISAETCADQWRSAEQARGSFPPGKPGDDTAASLVASGLLMAAELDAAGRTPDTRRTIAVDATVGRWTLAGTVTTMGLSSGGPTHVSMSKTKEKHQFGIWLELLALTVAHPDHHWHAMSLALNDKKKTDKGEPVHLGVMTIAGDGPAERHAVAATSLSELLDVMEFGLRHALPIDVSNIDDLANGTAPTWDRRRMSPYFRQAFGSIERSAFAATVIGGRSPAQWNQWLLNLKNGSTVNGEPNSEQP